MKYGAYRFITTASNSRSPDAALNIAPTIHKAQKATTRRYVRPRTTTTAKSK
jgi:hypothetical protein